MDSRHLSNCSICGGELEYLFSGEEFSCFYCGKKESGNIICASYEAHYVCDECHNLPSICYIKDFILSTGIKDPLDIVFEILNNSPVSIPMLGCHHAYMLTGSILASLRNNGLAVISDSDINEAFARLSSQAVGGYCGLSGVCGIVPAGGIIYSILTGSVCGKDKEQRITMRLTALLSAAIFELTGPSCCKAYLFKSMEIMLRSLYSDFGFRLTERDFDVKCGFEKLHPHGCLLERCPYYKGATVTLEELYRKNTEILENVTLPPVLVNAKKSPDPFKDFPKAPC